MVELNLLQKIAVWVLPIVFAITLHEVAHGWVARRLGDPTAEMLGRLTLNPVKHLDPIGSVLVPGVLLLVGGFIFGWAKPVPITVNNLRNPRRDMAWVALAGPSANLLMGLLWALLARIGLYLLAADLVWLGRPLVYMGIAGILINAMLMVLNLLPIPPLDGGRVLTSLLPPRLAWQVSRIEPYAFFILIGLILFHVLGKILGPPLMLVLHWMIALAGLSAGQVNSLLAVI
jgi:Zn-dependent protease